MNRLFTIMALSLLSSEAHAARLSMALATEGDPGLSRLDIVWTMNATDTAQHDLDGFSLRFNVEYPGFGHLIAEDISVLPGWNSSGTMGIGGPFTEPDFFLGADDLSGQGIEGNGTEFSTTIASIFLRAEGNVAGTEITFRHNNPQDPLPAAYDGPPTWQLRWQEEVNGPFQFDIGSGNPGDSGPEWDPYHGQETASPVTIFPPEPSSLALLLLAALALERSSRRMARTAV